MGAQKLCSLKLIDDVEGRPRTEETSIERSLY
jgi:hypothetical protein